MTENGITYLAGPYTADSPRTRLSRYKILTKVASLLIEKGEIVFSPITMTHPIDVLLAEDNATLGSEFWVRFDEAFMKACFRIKVLKIEGWDRSAGVKREIDYFRKMGREVIYLDPDEFEI